MCMLPIRLTARESRDRGFHNGGDTMSKPNPFLCCLTAIIVIILCLSPGAGAEINHTDTSSIMATPQGWPLDSQSTTGPLPPEGLFLGISAVALDYEVVISDVPAYLWLNGCGPTAAGMVIGYWDGQGYDELVDGSATSQTPAVNDMISSSGNYDDYCVPIDSSPVLLPDLSELPFGDEHPDDSVADFMKTSQSYHNNYYGWSWFSHVDDSLSAYVEFADARHYDAHVENLVWGSLTWTRFRSEIDANQPVILLVDTDGNGGTDHFVPAIGYGEQSGTLMYACLNTWDSSIHWYEFAQMAGGQPWGIYGATTCYLEQTNITIYVPDDYITIQEALDAALSGDSIIVRDGTYAGSGNKSLDFGGKAIVLQSENGPESCVIDCEGTGLAFNFHNNETSTSVVDGFKIVNGGPDSTAGIQCSNSSPTIKNCIISGNTSQTGGGGIACWDSSPTIINCTIIENEAGIGPGGGILCSNSSSPVIINCTISGNAADLGGGIASDTDSSPTLTNCILWNNSATLGPEIALTSSLTPSSLSSLTISYSDVEGGQAAVHVDGGCNLIWGDGNTNANPLFVGGGDYHLTSPSPCVNAGTDAGVYTDIDGDPRPQMGGFDMGSDECTQEPQGLTQINLTYPPDGAVVFLPPTFMWTAVGGTDNVFAADFSLSYPITRYWSTYENMGQLIRNESWTPSTQLWNRLPSGYVWWRVRGADLDQTPLAIITSEDGWFYKW